MKPKVLMIDVGGWGGITHYTYNLMAALARNGKCDCTLLTDRQYELEPLPRNFEIIKKSLNNQPYGRAVKSVFEAIRQVKPQIIHVQTMITARRDWLLFRLGGLLGKRIVLTCHNVLPHEDAEKQAFFMRQALANIYAASRAIIAHSEFSRARLIELFGVPAAKITVIPHGNYLFFRRTEMSQAEARQALGLPADARIVLQFGAIRLYKGIDVLLEAFAGVREAGKDVRLLLAGKPMHLDPAGIFEAIRRLGLEDAVIVKAGYVDFDDIAKYFFASDAAVFPYKEIDMSGSLQLAFAFERPVVAARSGGLPEVIEDGKNGLLFSANDVTELAGCLSRLLGDDALRQNLGQAGLRLARERFSWEPIAAGTVSVYERVIAQGK
ncbi:MAG: glycosyltransferase family 4 protein [Candidatus Omnitrophica bacterium]|nr:glycosyltransferase family 4 protein [Candidatus Omnitrophota bacterium]